MEAKIDQKEKEVASVWWGNEHWWINTLQPFLKYPGQVWDLLQLQRMLVALHIAEGADKV